MTQSIYGTQFLEKNLLANRSQHRIIFKALINRILTNNNDYDDTFKEFIEYNFPLDKLYELSDAEIRERINRLSSLNNLLTIDDISSLQTFSDILKGIADNVIPSLKKKIPNYEFFIVIISKNIKKILRKICNEHHNIINKLKYVSNLSSEKTIIKTDEKSMWMSIFETVVVSFSGLCIFFKA